MSEPTQANGEAHSFEVALRAARDSAGSARDVQRLRAQLQSKLMHESAVATPAAAAAPASVSFGKLALVGAGLLALGALYVGMNRSPATPRRAASSASSATTRPPPEQGTREPGANIGAAHDSTRASELALRATSPKQAASVREKTKQFSRSQARAAPVAGTADPQPRAARSDASTEIALITRAQGLLDLQPSAALTVLREHERQFPSGILAEERDVLRVEAERALGRTPQAIAHAKAFCAQYPNSPQTRTLEHWLAAQINPAADHK
jgi:hypothetical protein